MLRAGLTSGGCRHLLRSGLLRDEARLLRRGDAGLLLLGEAGLLGRGALRGELFGLCQWRK